MKNHSPDKLVKFTNTWHFKSLILRNYSNFQNGSSGRVGTVAGKQAGGCGFNPGCLQTFLFLFFEITKRVRHNFEWHIWKSVWYIFKHHYPPADIIRWQLKIVSDTFCNPLVQKVSDMFLKSPRKRVWYLFKGSSRPCAVWLEKVSDTFSNRLGNSQEARIKKGVWHN